MRSGRLSSYPLTCQAGLARSPRPSMTRSTDGNQRRAAKFSSVKMRSGQHRARCSSLRTKDSVGVFYKNLSAAWVHNQLTMDSG